LVSATGTLNGACATNLKKPVDGAVILESKTNMGPSGMGEMSGKVTATPPAIIPFPSLALYRHRTGGAGSTLLPPLP
jgi:hypothetical protein